ncbi:FitA-like ribbon-helix-helix domain-containing protein [Cryobacterium roopkundense]|uniref:Plasmid stability protein n=1 Tax=Cryobacterium roopkundense TaxID=1001240 RepID=A0A7W8ZTG6_9MICO|nr:hypothetical protein [Cryobacterium roopkundense]MBB5639572.1 plasmid stability protein [Cryobacterium roopkundense]
MAVITVRNLDDEVQRRLKLRAAAHNQSMEAEARAILSAAVVGGDFAAAWLTMAAEHAVDELPVPARSVPQDVDLT